QYLAGLDIITVQHSLDFSLEDYEAQLRFAERWMEERGVEKPMMPVIQATENKETSAKLLALVEKHQPSMIGFDLRGGFYYDVLAKAKVHDHLAQRKELEGARESIRKGRFLLLLNTKEYPREFLKQLPTRDSENRAPKD